MKDLITDSQALLQGAAAPTRRRALQAALGVGYVAAAGPVMAQTAIRTPSDGLVTGEVTIEVNGFKMPAYRSAPAGRTGLPVVLVVSEIFGVHEYIADVTRRLARAGYLAIAPELLASPWAIPLSRVAERYPALDVEVLAAPEADAINLLHEGRVQLALVFESTQFDSRECCQEMTRETLITVIAPTHPALASGRPLRMEELAEHRQILVAGRDSQERTPRFLQAHQHWRTDSHTAALSLIQAGLGWGFLPLSLVRPQLQAGTLIQLHLDNISNSGTLWVDLVWSRRRPLGLAAQYFIELIRQQPAVPI